MLAIVNEREQNASRRRKQSAIRAEVGTIPRVVNPRRREACRFDLLKFLTKYFPESTGKSPFGSDHVRFIRRLQVAVLEGGRFANATYRGFTKTTAAEGTAIWATAYGHRKYVPIFAADASLAIEMVHSIKLELSENDLLIADFPELSEAIIHLGGKPQGCQSQTYKGEPTHIEWMTDTVVLPTIRLVRPRKDIPTTDKGLTLSSGAIITAYGMTGSIRGLKHKRPDGTQQRPDFAIVDDPQTDESAGSDLQINKRLKLIRKTILRAAGHRTAMSCVVNGTIIRPRDLMQKLTDHSLSPDFQSERIPLVKKFADAHKALWLVEYKRLRTTYDKDVIGDQARAHAAANEFYAEHQAEMDAGCEVSWDSCFDADKELSAIQHAYNILIDDGEDVFASECQQSPLEDEPTHGAVVLTPHAITSKLNGYEAAKVPTAATELVGMIDVQQEMLFWLVAGFSRDFTGFVIGYNGYPDQKQSYYSLSDARFTLQGAHPGKSLEATIWAGLQALTTELCLREWKCDDGTSSMKIKKLLIDANWGKSTDTVYEFCRQSPFAAILMPSHGHFIGASSRPMAEYKHSPHTLRGPGWMIPPAGGRQVRHVTYDSNYWKTFGHNRLAAPFGQPGCVSLFGEDPRNHTLLGDHLTAEYFVPTTARGRTVDEWKEKPHKPDNHFLDCYTGTCVAASIAGCKLGEISGTRKVVKSTAPRVSELQI